MASKKSKKRTPVVFGKKLKKNRWDTWDIGPGGFLGELCPPELCDDTWQVQNMPGELTDKKCRDLFAAEAYIEKQLKQLFKKVGLG